MSVWDAAIIGGGPAGSSLAMFLARAGQKVVVCECDRLPRDKLCGEFLSGESRRLLEQLGCLGEIEAVRPAVIDRCRFTAPCGATCETALPSQAFGISRRALDRILLRHAERSGATVVEGARASALEEQDNGDARVDLRLDHGAHDSLSARIVVGAHGRREPIDRELDRAFLRRRHPYVGLKRHHRPRASGASLRELDGYVEVHAFDGGYCGLSRIEGGEVNVCMLVREAFLGGLPSPRWHDVRDAVCRANRILASRLDALEPSDEAVLAVAGVPFAMKEQAAGPVIFIGDAAGMIAPFCGDGQAMAMRSAQLLADLILDDAAPRGEALSQSWKRRWRREFALRVRLGRWIQPLLLHSSMANTAVRVARRLPFLTHWLARATRGA